MSPYTTACIDFEKDINLFVDHELADDGVARLSHHLQGCEPCREYVDDLRQLASLHRQAAPLLDAAMASAVDKHELFGSITRTLLVEKRGELAQLLYELGKAYVLKANEAMSGRLGRPTMVSLKKAVDIRSTSAQGRKLAREVEELETAGGQRETGSLFGRSRRLFSSSSRAGAGLLTNGRRLLEAALTVEPDLDPARLYLGLHHMLSGRFDRARLEFRRVYREAADPIHRTMAINMLGNVHATTYDFTRAIECYEEVVAAEPAGHEPLFTALINLAVNCVKAGHVAKGVHHFHELVDRFPAQVDETRTLLTKKQDFMNLLQRQVSLQRDLSRQIPALFAA